MKSILICPHYINILKIRFSLNYHSQKNVANFSEKAFKMFCFVSLEICRKKEQKNVFCIFFLYNLFTLSVSPIAQERRNEQKSNYIFWKALLRPFLEI